MFADAIENVSGFTKPILFISKGYKSFNIIPGSATMFFVNNNGVATAVAIDAAPNSALTIQCTITKVAAV